MRSTRALSLFFLVLLLAVNSVTMAVARHQPRAIGQIMLCQGTGVISVSVDAQGRPTGPVLPCPDCTPALNALPDLPLPEFVAALTLVPFEFPPVRAALVVLRPRPDSHPRAPPVAV